jgi:gamma-glutamyltranspeptidase/glutathione hydrolase
MLKYILIFTLLLNFSCSKKFDSQIWVGEKFSGFSQYKTTIGNDYMVSSSEELASKTGAKIIEQGGNAIDASVAMQMVLNVVEPHSSGIGGGLFLLYYDKKTQKTIYFNGRETAPSKAYPQMFLDKNNQVRKFHEVLQGGLSVGTPGALKTLYLAHKKFGKLKWFELFQPAIKIANEGFTLSNKMHVNLEALDYLAKFPEMKIYFEENGNIKKVGTKIKNEQLAKTFEIIANHGIASFYEGEIANDIVNKVNNSKVNPGLLSLNDLKNYQPKIGNLVCLKYRQKYNICSMPMPSGGVTTLQILGILENFDLAKIKPNSTLATHLFAEAARLALADRKQYLGDVDNKIISKLLDKNYLSKRARLISLDRAISKVEAGDLAINLKPNNEIFEKPSTTHFSIIDRQGNAVALTSSIEYFFGSALMVDGFMLNNQLTDFALNPYRDSKIVANAIAPNKQPLSSMAPTFVFDEKNKLIMTLGSPGGPRISQFVAKALIAQIDWGLDIQQAISLPNFVVINDRIELEDRTEISQLKKELEKMNHQVIITDITSGIHGIAISGDNYFGGADPRRNGYVATANKIANKIK